MKRTSPRMSLRLRLFLMVAGTMLVLLGIATVLRLAAAGNDVRAEMESNRQLLASSLPRRLDSIEEGFRITQAASAIRHVRLRLDFDRTPAEGAATRPARHAAPASIVSRAHEAPDMLERMLRAFESRFVPQSRLPRLDALPVVLDADSPVQGNWLVIPDSVDEWREKVSELRHDLMLIAGFGLALSALVFWSTGNALKPLRDVNDALLRLTRGELDTRMRASQAPAGVRELAALPHAFNEMASSLEMAVEERQELLDKLIAMEERTRRSLAHDLHDELSPYLVAMRMHMSVLESSAISGDDFDDEARAEATRTLSMHLRSTMLKVRSLLETLHPPELQSAGIVQALESLARLHDSPRCAVRFESSLAPPESGDSGPRFSEAIDTALYRTAQECILNALKHSDCSRIAIELGSADDPALIRLVVRNNGQAADQGFPRSGYGVLGIRERALALGGSFSTGPSMQGGWIADLRIPRSTRSARKEDTVDANDDEARAPLGDQRTSHPAGR